MRSLTHPTPGFPETDRSSEAGWLTGTHTKRWGKEKTRGSQTFGMDFGSDPGIKVDYILATRGPRD